MDRLFLDANVLFSAAYKPGARVSRLWKLETATLLTSRYALEEARFNLDDDDQRRRLTTLARRLHFVEATDRPLPRGVVLPEKDKPILLAAIEARAEYLLTGDIRHFGSYLGKKLEGVTIVTPAQYLEIREHNG